MFQATRNKMRSTPQNSFLYGLRLETKDPGEFRPFVIKIQNIIWRWLTIRCIQLEYVKYLTWTIDHAHFRWLIVQRKSIFKIFFLKHQRQAFMVVDFKACRLVIIASCCEIVVGICHTFWVLKIFNVFKYFQVSLFTLSRKC